ncbi:MAG: hypothetical protein M9885_08440 [Burkholderiaceae bacterium]|nr:hypothetical protein [Burkholderiaceae bacterium]
MSPALHAVARLIACPRLPPGHAARLSEALSDVTELPMATRLRLVALATRLEAGDRCECGADGIRPDAWVVPLAEAFLGDEAGALDALVANAPRLRGFVARAGERACRLPAAALLELLERKLH